jgi:hypothetical protein
MDYCACGQQADGRCTRCGDFLCRLHQSGYPSEILYALRSDGRDATLTLSRHSGPPLRLRTSERTLLCRTCRGEAIEETTPAIIGIVNDLEHGSPERTALRLLRCWLLSDPDRTVALGPALVTAVAGHRPDWLHDSPMLTLTVMYATLARAHSMTPPARQVVYQNAFRTYGWWSGEKIRRRTAAIDTVRAWTFTEKDDGRHHVLLVGAYGGAAPAGSEWATEGTVTIGDWKEYDAGLKAARDQVAALKRTLESPTPSFAGSGGSHGASGVLTSAIRSLLR